MKKSATNNKLTSAKPLDWIAWLSAGGAVVGSCMTWETEHRGYGRSVSLTGLDVPNGGKVVVAIAVIAVALIFGHVMRRDPRLSALAAVCGGIIAGIGYTHHRRIIRADVLDSQVSSGHGHGLVFWAGVVLAIASLWHCIRCWRTNKAITAKA